MNNRLKHLLFVLFTLSSTGLFAQFLLPNFGEPSKVDALNSYAEESMPLPCLEGNRLYFSRTYLEDMEARTEGQDIWYADRDKEGVWGKPQPFLTNNNPRINNSVIGTTKDAKKVFVFNTEYKKKKVSQKLTFTTNLGGNNWSDLQELNVPGLVLVDGYYSFYMTESEDVLVLSMAPADTNAFEDLYVSIKGEDNNWSEIIYLGDVVNTPDFEVTPFLAEDKKTLYFASNGHGGLGESDIFVTYRLDNTWKNWTKPLNLGAPINSDGFDAYFVIGNNREIYFTSNRGQDYSDIYYSKIKDGVKFVGNEDYILVNGKFIYDKLPVDGVTISIYDINDVLLDEVTTDKFGCFSYTKLDPEQYYILKVSDEDFINYPGAKIYMLDQNGKLARRYRLTKKNTYTLDKRSMAISDNVEGIYKYKNLPASESMLVIFDENDFPIDTITTNAYGKFQFKKMKADENYYLKPLDVSGDDYVNVDIVFTDGNDTLFAAKKDRNNCFVFDNVESQKALSVKKEATVMVADIKEEKISISKPVSGAVIITFDFNSIYFDNTQRKLLNEFAKSTKTNQFTEIDIFGHADNVGSESVNESVSEMRAQSVKRYLIQQGINERKINIIAKGESAPVASNKTKEGRAQNRRVEVMIK